MYEYINVNDWSMNSKTEIACEISQRKSFVKDLSATVLKMSGLERGTVITKTVLECHNLNFLGPSTRTVPSFYF